MGFIVKMRSSLSSGGEFGPFETEKDAETCVMALAARGDVTSATVSEQTKSE